MLATFMKLCRDHLDLIKMGQKYRALYRLNNFCCNRRHKFAIQPYNVPRRHRGGAEVYFYSPFNLGIRWEQVVHATPRTLYPPGRDPVPAVQGASWTRGPVLTAAEKLASTVIRSPHRAVRSETLYRLSHPNPLCNTQYSDIQLKCIHGTHCCFYIATMVTRTRRNFTLYVSYPTCFSLQRAKRSTLQHQDMFTLLIARLFQGPEPWVVKWAMLKRNFEQMQQLIASRIEYAESDIAGDCHYVQLKNVCYLLNKTNRCTELQFYWYYGFTCFGQSFCPSSGVLSRTSALIHFMQL